MKYLYLLLILGMSNFTYGQLALEKDINIEPESSEPSTSFAELDGIIYFRANDGIHDDELYSYDSATGEATLTSDTRIRAGSSGMTEVIVYEGKLYYASRAEGGTLYLYTYDPVTKESTMVRDDENQRIREPSNFEVYDNKLFYRVVTSSTTDEAQYYNAATNAVRSLGHIRADGRSNVGNFAAVNDRLYFRAFADDSGSNLFYYDTATDTIHRYEYTTANGTYGVPNQLTHIDGWLFYSDGSELSRGTTTAINLDSGEAKTFSIFEFTPSGEGPNEYFAFDGKLYFSAFSNSPKRALYAFDPATAEVTKKLQLMTDASTAPASFTELAGKLYFTVQANTDDDPKIHLYSYDPATGDYTDEATLADDTQSGFMHIGMSAHGKLYCSGYGTDVGRELWTFTPGTSELVLAADINTNTASAEPSDFTEYDGELYFIASAYQIGSSLYKYDPATGLTDRVTAGVFSLRNLEVVQGRLYFDGSIDTSGYGLNYYDAATGAIVTTDWRSPSCINCMQYFTQYNDKLYMQAQMDDDVGAELYVYDPSSGTGELVDDIDPDGSSRPSLLITHEGELYFRGRTDVGTQLYRYSASTGDVLLVQDKENPTLVDQPSDMTSLGTDLYFRGRGESTRYELYKYDPIAEALTQLTTYDSGMRPSDLVAYRDQMYFAGTPSNSIGRELHSYDPLTDTVTLELDLTQGGSSSGNQWLGMTVYDDKLYFAHVTDEYGTEFWQYADGEASIIADIRLGALGSEPELFTLFNDKLYFRANDGETGTELWSYASCINATVETTPQMDSELGSIDISVTGGTPPYSFVWNDGLTTEDRPAAEAGDYSLTVYDATGCIITIAVEVTFVSDTKQLEAAQQPLAYPNPTKGLTTVSLPPSVSGTIYVRTLTGRLVLTKQVQPKQQQYTIDLSSMPPGSYVLQLVTAEYQSAQLLQLR